MITVLLGTLSLVAFMALLWSLSGLWNVGKYDYDERIIGGFTTFVLTSNAIHLFTGLTSFFATLTLGTLAILGASRLFRSHNSVDKISLIRRNVGLSIGAFIIVSILARLSAKPTLNYDAWLYHFASVEALSSERLIIGWSVLHDRLATPSSVFNVAAFLENGPWGNDGYRLTGAVFVCISLVFFGEALRRVSVAQGSPGDLLTALALPAVWSWGMFQPYWFNGPSLDVPAALIAVIASAKLADFTLRRDLRSFEMAALSVVGAYSVRPLNLVLVAILVLCLIALCPRKRRVFCTRRNGLPIAFFMMLMFRSTLLSGFPLAPLPLSVPGLSWSLDRRQLEGFALTVRSWARRFGGTEDVGLFSFGWLPEWWAINSSALTPVVSLGLLGVLFLMLGPRDVWVSRRTNIVAMVVVGAIPVSTWFFASPALRFGWGQLAVCGASWVLAIDLTAERRERFDRFAAGTFRTLVTCCAGLLVLVPLVWGQRGLLIDTGPQLPISPADESPALVGVATANSVEVKMPRVGDQCGWEIWCSPRDPGSVSVSKFGLWWVVSRS